MPTGQNDFGMIAGVLRFISKVIRIDPDAMSSDQTRPERQEIPFGSGGLQHRVGIDVHLMKQHRQLVHERDVNIPLGVFDDLGGLRDPDALRPVDAGINDQLV
ncbi:hypothetical protein D3C76_1699050 [compost metagenome]